MSMETKSSSELQNVIDEEKEVERQIEHFGGDVPAPSNGLPSFLITPKDPNQVDWDEDDPENPQSWSRTRKWTITCLCALLTVNISFASSVTTASISSYVREFGSSREVFMLSTTFFLDGYVIGPLIWAPLSELFGRKILLMGCMFSYSLFQIGGALSHNTASLLVFRLLTGTFAAAPLTNSGGIIADMWDPVTRGYAVSLFILAVFMGPVMGPIIGGFVVQSYLGWRWVYWILCIFGMSTTMLATIFIPETYAPVLLQRRAKRLRREDPVKNKDLYAELENTDFTLMQVFLRTLVRPYKLLMHEMILVLVTIYLSIVYGILYSLFSVFPLVYQVRRGFTIGESGLMFIPVGLGVTIGGLYSCYLFRKYEVLTPKWYGFPPPEERLTASMVAGPVLVVSTLALGWTGQYPSVPWYVPGIISIFTGFSLTLLFTSLITYVVDTYLLYSASALAANTAIRSVVASVFPLFTLQMYTRLGIHWACTLVAGISLLTVPAPFIFHKYGHRIRASSRYAPCLDLKLRDVVLQKEKSMGGENSTA